MQDSLIAKRNAEAAKQNTLQANRGQVANLKVKLPKIISS